MLILVAVLSMHPSLGEIIVAHEDSFELGKAAFDARKYEDAIARFTDAIQKDPKRAEAYRFRGRARHVLSQYEKAIADYTAAIQLEPKIAQTFVWRGESFGHRDEPLKAIDDYSEAIRLDPANGNILVSRGVALFWEKQYPRALADLTRALQLIPPMDKEAIEAVHWYRGHVHYAMGNFRDAVTEYRQSTIDAPSDSTRFFYLSRVLATCPDAKVRDGKAGLEAATKACDLTKWKDPQSLEVLAASYAALSQFEKAVKWQEKATELLKKDSALLLGAENRLQQYRLKKPLEMRTEDEWHFPKS